jgi:hypothetical protein
MKHYPSILPWIYNFHNTHPYCTVTLCFLLCTVHIHHTPSYTTYVLYDLSLSTSTGYFFHCFIPFFVFTQHYSFLTSTQHLPTIPLCISSFKLTVYCISYSHELAQYYHIACTYYSSMHFQISHSQCMFCSHALAHWIHTTCTYYSSIYSKFHIHNVYPFLIHFPKIHTAVRNIPLCTYFTFHVSNSHAPARYMSLIPYPPPPICTSHPVLCCWCPHSWGEGVDVVRAWAGTKLAGLGPNWQGLGPNSAGGWDRTGRGWDRTDGGWARTDGGWDQTGGGWAETGKKSLGSSFECKLRQGCKTGPVLCSYRTISVKEVPRKYIYCKKMTYLV